MKNSGSVYFFALCALFAFISCTREAVGTQSLEENLPIQNNVVLPVEILENNFTAAISDLNGTWVTEWSYDTLMGMAEEERGRYTRNLEFSWGEGKRLAHSQYVLDTTIGLFLTTVSIDITDERPFVSAGMFGSFIIASITQPNTNSIKVYTFSGHPDAQERGRDVEFTFHFINSDTVLIESDELRRVREEGIFWRRLSGADERQANAVLTAERPENNFSAEIVDLNGTWLPEFSYHAPEEGREGWRIFMQEFSWGEAKWIIHLSLNIDITAERPFISESVRPEFIITDITQFGVNTIKVNAAHDRSEDRVVELVFHFVDRDTFWIDTHDFRGLNYERGAFWHRISGPTRGD